MPHTLHQTSPVLGQAQGSTKEKMLQPALTAQEELWRKGSGKQPEPKLEVRSIQRHSSSSYCKQGATRAGEGTERNGGTVSNKRTVLAAQIANITRHGQRVLTAPEVRHNSVAQLRQLTAKAPE